MTSRVIATVLTASLLGLACVQDGGNSTPADTSGGDDGPPCAEQLPELPPLGNPEFVGTVSGEAMPNLRATRIASANIARVANDSACCQDYVVAGGTNAVTIKFAAAHDGLTFLANRADETVAIGSSTQSARDLAVGDLNADNRNDIVVLRSDGVVVVALAVPAPPMNGPYFGVTSNWTMAVAGYVPGASLDLADMDADGDLDLFITSTTTRILWRKNNGNGMFAAASHSNAGITTQNLVMARVNAGNQADALVAGSDGRFAYLRSTGNGFAPAALHRIASPGANTTGMLIAAGRICPGHPTTTAVAVAFYDYVKVACSDGAGGFANVLEPHGEQEDVANDGVVDYLWDSAEGLSQQHLSKDLTIWTPADSNSLGELYAHYDGGLGTLAEWKIPGTCGIVSRAMPLARWGSAFDSMIVHRESVGDSTWGGFACAGSLGLLSVH